MNARDQQRKIFSKMMIGLTLVCALVSIIPLLSIFAYLVTRGASSVNIDFFIHLPKPVGETGGGMANAIVGSFVLIGMACLWAVPVGVLGGVYVAEFSGKKTASVIRFTADVLSGLPSIVVGIFAYGLFVLPFKTFSSLSGGFALGFMLIPTVIRTTEQMLQLVPTSLREGGLALGISRYRTTIHIVMRTAMPGILTGVLLAVARIAGETAPLLFTAFGNRVWSHSLMEPIAALPLQIFAYAISPYDDWRNQAWAGALVLICIVFSLTLASRVWTHYAMGSRHAKGA